MTKKYFNYHKGYTLIELLAVMAILITVGTIIAGIIVSSLRGSNRSKNVGNVRQAGNTVLVQMSKTIKFAKSFDGISINETNYVTDCIVPVTIPIPTPIPYKYLKLTSSDDTQTIFACKEGSVFSNTDELIDQTNLTGFSIPTASCYFICSQTNIAVPPTISINFTVSTVDPTSAFAENRVSLDFKTSAAFRNN